VISLETPFETLRLDVELVASVRENPEALRKLAAYGWRALAAINHPDAGGDGRLIVAAQEAVAEVNGSTDEQMIKLASEFLAVRHSEEVQRARERERLARYQTCERRRADECAAVIRCGLAPRPEFGEALIELGICSRAPIERGMSEEDRMLVEEAAQRSEPDEFGKGIGTQRAIPRLVLVDNSLAGTMLKSKPAKSWGSFELNANTVTVRKDRTVVVQGVGMKRNEGPARRRWELVAGDEWTVESGTAIFGMVGRRHLESHLGPARPLLVKGSLTSGTAGTGAVLQLNWQDPAKMEWLRFLSPAGVDELEGRYLIAARVAEDGVRVAVVGLCHKLVRHGKSRGRSLKKQEGQ